MLLLRIYRFLLWCYPAPFRQEYRDQMAATFYDELREARHSGGWTAELAAGRRNILDIALTAPQEHYHVIQQDVRYALRNLIARPGFAAVAILSLALGIGANTAIFSLMTSVLRSMLPVADPQSLVMLTNPASGGVAVGVEGNERSLLSYAEFELLRDKTTVFSALMACQSTLNPLHVRINGGESEEVRARMVSAEYFTTLSVPPVLGQTFRPDDNPAAAHAVISYAYWQRRFGRRPDILGTKIAIHKSVFEIIGVAPSSFFGETVGERPDVWLPLQQQPAILPGRDWLHDRSGNLEKVMWLHAFGRLKPGVTIETAQAAANVAFHQGLVLTYGAALTPDNEKDFLNQRLKLRPAAFGASSLRQTFAEPLNILLAASALVLLIACANLGNLLLTRTITRTREIAVRLALGAGRGRLIRQFITESMVLAVLGGVAGMGAAWLIRAGLLRLVSDSVYLQASPDLRIFGFAFAITLGAGLLMGLLPAWRTWKLNAAPGLAEQGRGLTGSAAWQRAGKLVVVAQLALSLPLLIGASLLMRTLHNLQHLDLGYPKEHLLVMRIDAQTPGYEPARQLPLFNSLLERIAAVPGVSRATYSNNGLFIGGDNADEVIVEGYTRQGKDDRGSRYDHIGPNYFSTLGIPLLMGREILASDQASGNRVCVINEAFAKRFFSGRNPLGLHVTQVYGNDRNTFQIVGVARDSRARRLRGDIEHRYYPAAAQPIFPLDTIAFSVRTAADPASVLASVRRAILDLDPNLPITIARPVTELVEERVGQERMMAQLSLVFGGVGLLLAVIGLYGVVSYGVSRRTNEIGIRKALGARHSTLVTMILRETCVVVILGLVAGTALAAATMRLIASRLHGLAPTDPLAFVSATLVLLSAALIAAWLPARRASQVDPLVALRHD